MTDRHLLGDIAFAILIALPAVTVVQPQPPKPSIPAAQSSLVDRPTLADRTSAEHRVSLLG
jgi:hypothetical protein